MERAKNLSLVAFAIAWGFLFHAAFCYPASAQVNYEVLKRGVVKIIGHTPDHVESGAGIIVGLDENIVLIVTAYHVVKDANPIEVVFFDKQYKEFPGKLFTRYYEDLDIAVITVDLGKGSAVLSDLQYFILGDITRLREGEPVSTIGHPGDHEWQASIKTNTIAGLSDQEDFRKFRFTKTALDRGNSGGPVLNEQGALIGMVAKLDQTVYAVAVKIDTILSVLGEEWRIPVWWRTEGRKVALARELVAQAIATRNLLATREPDEEGDYWWHFLKKKGRAALLQRSVLFAVESIQRFPSPETEQALRDGLAWLTRPMVRMEHDKPVGAIAFSPDGKYLATGSDDKTARVWEVPSGREVARLPHQDSVRKVVFSPDGKYLATGSDDKTARVWEMPSGQKVARLSHQDVVRVVTFSPDGKYLATGSDDKTARVWEVPGGREVAHLSHQGFVRVVTFSPDGKYLATGSDDKTARVWEVPRGREVARVSHQRLARGVTFSPDGKYLATASEDSTAGVWEVPSSRQVGHMIHKADVEDVAFSPDGKYLATGSQDATARVWEVPSGREVARLLHTARVITVAFSPDGKYLATGSQDITARVWEMPSGREVARMIPSRGNVGTVAFSPDGKYLATQSYGETAEVWLWWPEDLITEACTRLTRNLTPEEWRQYLGEEPYQKTCPNLP